MKILVVFMSIYACYLPGALGVDPMPVYSSCPLHCDCKESGITPNFTEVSCDDRYLNAVPENVKGLRVDFLDLSNNDISTLKANSFITYKSLQVLYLHFTEIDEVEDHAFDGLDNINEIDMSDNYITEINPKMFITLSKLEILSLSGNPLVDIDMDNPILKSVSIKYLDISYCKILSVTEKSFSDLPNLEKLDISSNSLKYFKSNYLLSLTHLKFVDFSNNPWACDCETKNVIEWVSSLPSSSVEEAATQFSDVTTKSRKRRFAVDEAYQKPIQCMEYGKYRKLWAVFDKNRPCQPQYMIYTKPQEILVTSSTVSRQPREIETTKIENVKTTVIPDYLNGYEKKSFKATNDQTMQSRIPSRPNDNFLERNMPTIYSISIVILIFVFSVLGTLVAIRYVVPRIIRKNTKSPNYSNQLLQNIHHGYTSLPKDSTTDLCNSNMSIVRPTSNDNHNVTGNQVRNNYSTHINEYVN